jgi:hypothetical protein
LPAKAPCLALDCFVVGLVSAPHTSTNAMNTSSLWDF